MSIYPNKYLNPQKKNFLNFFKLHHSNVNITDRQTHRQTHQKHSSEPHQTPNPKPTQLGQPTFLLAHAADLLEVVEGAGARGAERGAHPEGNEAVVEVAVDGGAEGGALQREAGVGGQEAEADERDERRLLHGRVRLRGAVGDELAVDGRLLAVLVQLGRVVPAEGGRSRCQQRVVCGFAGGRLKWRGNTYQVHTNFKGSS